MTPQPEDFVNLLKQGKVNEARALLDEEKRKSAYAPDTIKANPARFYRGSMQVELGEDGAWRPLKPPSGTR